MYTLKNIYTYETPGKHVGIKNVMCPLEKTQTRLTPGLWGSWWKWQSCTGSTSAASFSSAPTACCTSSSVTAWSPWMTWRRWMDSGEIRGPRIVEQMIECWHVCPKIESSPSSYHREGVFCLCVWMQWFHRVRPEGGCGHGLLHIALFHTAEQPLLQQHQPATWNLCSWITWPRQVSDTEELEETFLAGDIPCSKLHSLKLKKMMQFSSHLLCSYTSLPYCSWLLARHYFCFSWTHLVFLTLGVQWIGFRWTMGVSWSSARMPVAKMHQREEYWRLRRGKIMVSFSFHEKFQRCSKYLPFWTLEGVRCFAMLIEPLIKKNK